MYRERQEGGGGGGGGGESIGGLLIGERVSRGFGGIRLRHAAGAGSFALEKVGMEFKGCARRDGRSARAIELESLLSPRIMRCVG